MKLSDRSLGYLVMGLILAAGLLVTALMMHAHKHARNRAVAYFDELGSLQPEDQVTMRGFPVGKVYSVTWHNQRARVEMDFEKPLVLHEGCRILNENFSLMGERRIEILDDKKRSRLPADTEFEGEFQPGIAEALHLMSEVTSQLLVLQNIASLLAEGDSTQPSLHDMLFNTLQSTEKVIDGLDGVVRKGGPQLRQTLRQASSLSEQVVSLSGTTDTTLEQIYRDGGDGIRKAAGLATSLQSTVVRMTLMLDSLDREPVWQELFHKRELLDRLHAFVASMDKLTRLIDDQGIVILDSAGNRKGLVSMRNLNVFGKTAREKAEDRKKSGE